MEGADMANGKTWYGASNPTETGVNFMQSLFAPLFRAPTKAPAPALGRALLMDAGAEASWTASLHRGNDLPPFLLCVHMTAESRSAVRFGPIGSGSIGAEL
jgi:hypothetical protein